MCRYALLERNQCWRFTESSRNGEVKMDISYICWAGLGSDMIAVESVLDRLRLVSGMC